MDYQDLEHLVRQRLEDTLGTDRGAFDFRYVGPHDRGGEYWDVHVNLGTNRITSSHNTITREEGLRTILRRPDPREPPWQETLKEALLYIPWDTTEPWWKAQTKQEAWDACPDARHLLWVIARRKLSSAELEGIKALVLHFMRLAYMSLPERFFLEPLTRIYFGIESGKDIREIVSAEYQTLGPMREQLLGASEDELTSWRLRRVVVYGALVVYGSLHLLDSVAEHSTELQYAVFPKSYVNAALVRLVRRHFPNERFSKET